MQIIGANGIIGEELAKNYGKIIPKKIKLVGRNPKKTQLRTCFLK
jgi:hypothetical protein